MVCQAVILLFSNMAAGGHFELKYIVLIMYFFLCDLSYLFSQKKETFNKQWLKDNMSQFYTVVKLIQYGCQ